MEAGPLAMSSGCSQALSSPEFQRFQVSSSSRPMSYLDRTRKNFVRGAALAAIGTALLGIALNSFGALDWLEDDAYDTRMSLSARPNTGDPNIVILDVDDPSFAAFKDLFGHWPPTRVIWSETVKYVSRGKPRAVVFDAMFSGPDSGFG